MEGRAQCHGGELDTDKLGRALVQCYGGEFEADKLGGTLRSVRNSGQLGGHC